MHSEWIDTKIIKNQSREVNNPALLTQPFRKTIKNRGIRYSATESVLKKNLVMHHNKANRPLMVRGTFL
ncbi:MAG: hypothetical protein ACJATP_002606 [Candidatus Azotimanducaceae bacterium]|jgi:hypothetical protein